MPEAGSQITSVGCRAVVAGNGDAVLDHRVDDMSRRAELAVLPGASDAAQHVFIGVALRVPVFHRDLVQLLDNLGQQGRIGKS